MVAACEAGAEAARHGHVAPKGLLLAAVQGEALSDQSRCVMEASRALPHLRVEALGEAAAAVEDRRQEVLVEELPQQRTGTPSICTGRTHLPSSLPTYEPRGREVERREENPSTAVSHR